MFVFSTVRNDRYPFEGHGNILGNAFRPGNRIGGDIHFYDNEMWTYDQTGGLFKCYTHSMVTFIF